ncbi:STAS domain-containing protein [Streptomyces bobili]|uniref:STAS domain-containing protein n=1 Tax=Streptomyces bobili TaxID=67280 RepID=UPI003793ED5A
MCLALAGDLDYDTCGDVLDQVRQALLDRDDVENLRLNCRELAVVDSMGLSTLLQIHPPPVPTASASTWTTSDRHSLLEVTGTYEYLTDPSAG